jgi:Zn-dependent protease
VTLPAAPAAATRRCADCATELSERSLACPACSRLVHGDELRRLAAAAEAAEREGALTDAHAHWVTVATLLPPTSRQFDVARGRMEAISQRMVAEAGRGTATQRQPGNVTAGLGAGALGVALLTALKFGVAGVTKSGPLLALLASVGIFVPSLGWGLAAGLVASIYLHELGHIFAFRRFGLPASAPMFVPGLGAFVRGQVRPPTAAIDGRIGLAGPIWGTVAALGFLAAGMLTESDTMCGVAQLGAVINLLNLLPAWQLDGVSVFRALHRGQRWLAVAALSLLAVVAHNGVLVVLAAGAAYRAWSRVEEPAGGDRSLLAQWLLCVVLLAVLTRLPSGP